MAEREWVSEGKACSMHMLALTSQAHSKMMLVLSPDHWLQPMLSYVCCLFTCSLQYCNTLALDFPLNIAVSAAFALLPLSVAYCVLPGDPPTDPRGDGPAGQGRQ